MPAPIVIIPLFNHAKTIPHVLSAVAEQGLSILVVDDGSSDGGADVAEQWFASSGAAGGVVRMPENRGKAAALLAGFQAARERGATHALTVDADGQHDASRIPAFLGELNRHSDHVERLLVLGDRRPLPRHYPLARLIGRTLSGLAIRVACGVQVGDAACGMRLYPLALVAKTPCRSGRYAWEEEAITRMAWGGAMVRDVTIPVIYRDKATAPSHYRFGRDWTEGTIVLVSTILRRIAPFGGTRWPDDGANDLAWPLAVRVVGRDSSWLLAIFATAVASIVHGTTSLVAGLLNIEATAMTAVAGAAMLWATWRVRGPMLATISGAALGTALPIVSLLGAAPIAAILIMLTMHRRRAGGA
jgi:hypothetical protein